MHYRKLALLALIAIVAIVGVACGSNKDDEALEDLPEIPMESDFEFIPVDRSNLADDQVVATFEGGEIKGAAFAKFLSFHGFITPSLPVNEPDLREELLQFMITQEIVGPQAQDTAWIEERIDGLWEQFLLYFGEDMMARGYEIMGLTEEEVRTNLYEYFLTEAYFRERITEDEIRESYHEFIPELTSATVRHILISSEERGDEAAKELADDLYQELLSGADFAELAKEHSEDPGSSEQGGIYEDMPVVNWVPEFKQAALDQDIGVIGAPVKTDFGYHIIRVEDRTLVEYEEVRDALLGRLTTQKVDSYVTETLPDLIKEINI